MDPHAKATAAALTDRQRKVVSLVAEGLTNQEIAEKIGCNREVIKKEMQSIYRRTGFDTRMKLAKWAIIAGLLVAQQPPIV